MVQNLLHNGYSRHEYKELYVFHHFYNPKAFITYLILLYFVLNMSSRLLSRSLHFKIDTQM